MKYELATFSTESRKALEPLLFLECKYRNSESENWLPVKHLNFKFLSSAGTISETQISRRDSSQFFSVRRDTGKYQKRSRDLGANEPGTVVASWILMIFRYVAVG